MLPLHQLGIVGNKIPDVVSEGSQRIEVDLGEISWKFQKVTFSASRDLFTNNKLSIPVLNGIWVLLLGLHGVIICWGFRIRAFLHSFE